MDDERLIALVQERPVLFDKAHPKYSSRDFVRKKWEEIGEEINENVEALKKRWVYLRDYFKKQKRSLESLKSGQAATKRRKWPLFDQMLFLAPYQTPTETSGNLDLLNEGGSQSDTDTLENDSITNSLSPSPTLPVVEQESFKRPSSSGIRQPGKKRKATDFDMEVLKALKEPEGETDGNDLFFKSLLPMVRKLDPVDAMMYRHEVQGLLIRSVQKSQRVLTPETPPTPFSQAEYMHRDVSGAGQDMHFSTIQHPTPSASYSIQDEGRYQTYQTYSP